jgi:hypothetical protein
LANEEDITGGEKKASPAEMAKHYRKIFDHLVDAGALMKMVPGHIEMMLLTREMDGKPVWALLLSQMPAWEIVTAIAGASYLWMEQFGNASSRTLMGQLIVEALELYRELRGVGRHTDFVGAVVTLAGGDGTAVSRETIALEWKRMQARSDKSGATKRRKQKTAPGSTSRKK